MAIKYTLADGGYVMSNGDIQVVGVEGDHKHGERAKCLEAHTHVKNCAKVILDVPPIIKPAVPAHTDGEGNEVPEEPAVLGKTLRQRMEEHFAGRAAQPPAPTHVEMPKKTVDVRDEKTGKLVKKQVEDRDLE
jgi:hypothetical protein